MKKVLVLLALLAAVCGLLTFSAAAESAVASGICGENLTWTLDAAGTLTVSGTGAMKDYNYKGAPWHQSRDSIQAVVVENGVTVIGEYAFESCTSLTSITIPESVTTIGHYAFSDCSSLSSITIPKSVATIGDYAFSYCSNLTSITIPEGVTAIGGSAFYRCSSLKDVSITDLDAWCRIDFADSSATPMCNGGNLLLNGQKLVSVTVPEGVTEVKAYTFYGFKDLIQVTFPEGVTAIGYSAFSDCSSLTSITIPEGVTAIDYRAFSGCSSLISITIPESVTTIGDAAFSGCSSLISIKLPEGVTTIGRSAFSDCSSLSSITLPESVTAIGRSAFSDCSSLTSITIPEGVTAIGDSAFSGCSSLTSITIPESVTAIGDSAFSGCSSLTSITIPESVTTIGNAAFSGCSILSSITIPESVTTIGGGAFFGCTGLSSITLPESVTVIGDHAFFLCSSLKDVYITDLAAWCSIAFGNEEANPLYKAENLYLNGELVETLEIPEGVTMIRQGLFRNAACIRRVALPKSLKGVLANAFYGCRKIQEVFYAGSEAEWNALPIATGNDPLKNATIYFNSTMDDYYCRITVVASEGGRVAVSANTAKAGDTVTVTATPYRGYVMSAIYVDGAEISGDTFTVTGNHRVSAVFTRLPIVGGNEDFRLEGITVLDGAGNPLQELPAERLLVTVTVRHLKESGGGTVMLAQYDEKGRYQGLLWLTLEEMPQDMTLKVTLPVDNTGGSIAQLKVFLVESLLSPAPVGEAISFGTI